MINKDHKNNEILSHRFCNFVGDPHDELAYQKKDFIDLGVL